MISQSETVIAKWDGKQLLKSYYKVRQKFIAKCVMSYKLHLVEQSVSGIKSVTDYYYEMCEVPQSVTGCYYKVRQVLQSET